jgi:uncharacterized membrane protein
MMLNLVLAASAFATLHLFVSGTPLRGVFVRRIGEGPYRGLFSLATLVTLVWLSRSYSAAFASDNVWLWHWPMAQHAAAPIMLIAFLLAVPGIASRNPASVGQERVLQGNPEPHGMQRITRHPFLWGVAIWAAFHIAANGDVASIVLFATFLVVALVGTRSIDRKRSRALGAVWTAYEARTSNLPFAAIAQGRNRLALREIGWWRPLLALALFALVVALHPRLFGAYPLPGMAD